MQIWHFFKKKPQFGTSSDPKNVVKIEKFALSDEKTAFFEKSLYKEEYGLFFKKSPFFYHSFSKHEVEIPPVDVKTLSTATYGFQTFCANKLPVNIVFKM
jgi:hypothetical protein